MGGFPARDRLGPERMAPGRGEERKARHSPQHLQKPHKAGSPVWLSHNARPALPYHKAGSPVSQGRLSRNTRLALPYHKAGSITRLALP